jgi:hypothetical protein
MVKDSPGMNDIELALLGAGVKLEFADQFQVED